MSVPEQFRYTEEHEWVDLIGDGTIRVGITDYAQDQLGDVVFVELPVSGSEIGAGDMFAEVESTKSVAEVYAPIGGTIETVNEALADSPELVNTDPYGEGWFVVLRPSEPPGEDAFMDAGAYRNLIE
ncbi:glycine cleavage system protein GcvH [soil metagenome]